jgi:hypothetical protein
MYIFCVYSLYKSKDEESSYRNMFYVAAGRRATCKYSRDSVFLWHYNPQFGAWPTSMILSVSLGLLDLRYSTGLLGRVINPSQGRYMYRNTENARTYKQALNIYALSGVRTHNAGFRASEDSTCLRPLGYRHRLILGILGRKYEHIFKTSFKL